LVKEADTLIGSGEQPEVISLTGVLFSKHASKAGAFCCQVVQIWCSRTADDLIVILVLLDNDEDVVVSREGRGPRRRIGAPCRQRQSSTEQYGGATPKGSPHPVYSAMTRSLSL
jgi:hypothetical protein